MKKFYNIIYLLVLLSLLMGCNKKNVDSTAGDKTTSVSLNPHDLAKIEEFIESNNAINYDDLNTTKQYSAEITKDYKTKKIAVVETQLVDIYNTDTEGRKLLLRHKNGKDIFIIKIQRTDFDELIENPKSYEYNTHVVFRFIDAKNYYDYTDNSQYGNNYKYRTIEGTLVDIMQT